MSEINWQALAAPFPANEIEWRIAQAGKSGEKIWAKVLAYVSNRAIQHRLDEVLTPANWRNEYTVGPQGGVLCGISIRVNSEWVTKYDGADNTDIEAIKGGLSDAMKRAAVQWGIGRYLYDLEEGWAEICEGKKPGSRYANCKVKVGGKEEYVNFNWLPPKLPEWALPKAKLTKQGLWNLTKPLVEAGRLTLENIAAMVKEKNEDYDAVWAHIESLIKEAA